MTKNVGIFDDHGANAASMPKVDVRSVCNTPLVDRGIGCERKNSNPHIPVLLMLIVTSPGLRDSLFRIVSTDG